MADTLKILIVDDEYQFCKSLKTFLDKNGFNTLFTTSGEHALDLIAEEKPDVLTLDMRMPGMNGYEVLEKAKWEQADMKIIIVTAIDVPNMEEMLSHAGAYAVFQKPIDLEKLLATLREIANP